MSHTREEFAAFEDYLASATSSVWKVAISPSKGSW